MVQGRDTAEGRADRRRRPYQGSGVRTGRRTRSGFDRRGVPREVSRQPLSRTDDRCACAVRDRTDPAAGRGSMSMKQLLVYGASMLAVALGGGAVAQEPDGQYFQVAEIEVDPAQVGAYRAAIEEQIDAAIRKEPGVLVLYAVAEKDDPTRVKVLEIY